MICEEVENVIIMGNVSEDDEDLLIFIVLCVCLFATHSQWVRRPTNPSMIGRV